MRSAARMEGVAADARVQAFTVFRPIPHTCIAREWIDSVPSLREIDGTRIAIEPSWPLDRSRMRVLVIAESAQRAEVLRAGLRLGGHELVELVALSSALEPALAGAHAEMLMLEANEPAPDLVDRVLDAMGDAAIPLAIFADHPSHECIEHSVRAGVGAYVVGPIDAGAIAAIVELAVARFAYLNELRYELGTAQQKLAERKFVERAKGLLMKARNISEDEAYHTLRRMAMERNRRMGEVARSVIEMAELLN